MNILFVLLPSAGLSILMALFFFLEYLNRGGFGSCGTECLDPFSPGLFGISLLFILFQLLVLNKARMTAARIILALLLALLIASFFGAGVFFYIFLISTIILFVVLLIIKNKFATFQLSPNGKAISVILVIFTFIYIYYFIYLGLLKTH